MLIGEIKEIHRYPVKSLAGESLQQVQVERYGIYGDRSHALMDPTQEGWDRFITARDIPKLLSYRARFEGEGSERQFPEVAITDTEGRTFGWNDEFLSQFDSLHNKRVALETHAPDSEELLAVDASSILIITESSIKALEQRWGHPVDPRRFRANFLVTLYEDVPFSENDWLQRTLTIGSIELQVDELCERCSMITIQPDTLQRDSSLLKLIHQERNTMFGVYASVIETGTVRVGDKISIE
ncbi:MOSC domain-containing protein [Paenibacillus sp. UNC451MF]|uniref:MOSC domain-containing protein n=1 Tax=Paenibacillus sp. UNC451MF TaxID=1449063 RepID=UPI00048C4380|nr:MOSC domain-containing protein [Paenibacillus sp. UNC451MF]